MSMACVYYAYSCARELGANDASGASEVRCIMLKQEFRLKKPRLRAALQQCISSYLEELIDETL